MARCGGRVKLSTGNWANRIFTAQCPYKLRWCFLPHVSFGHDLDIISGSLSLVLWQFHELHNILLMKSFEQCSIRVSFGSLKLRPSMDTLFFKENILSARFLPGSFASSSGITNVNINKKRT